MLAQYLVNNLNTHNIWAAKLVIAEMMYFLNVLGNIYLIDVFLGHEFSMYGLQVLAMMQDDSENRPDPMARVFPRVTKCTFWKYG